MLSLPPSVKIFVARDHVDMRKAFDGLSAVVRDILSEDPLSGHLFVFFNRRRDRVKILWWDRSGFWLLYKRLEKGTFAIPHPDAVDASVVHMSSADLTMILEGIESKDVRQRVRYSYTRPN